MHLDLKHTWKNIKERPIATSLSLLIIYLCIHFPGKLIDDAISSWVNDQISVYFGIPKPSIGQVFNIFLNWILPLIIAVMTMLVYHATRQPESHRVVETPSQDLAESRRNLVLPASWFFVAFAVAIFSIGEIIISQAPGKQGLVPASAASDARNQYINSLIREEFFREIKSRIMPHLQEYQKALSEIEPALVDEINCKIEPYQPNIFRMIDPCQSPAMKVGLLKELMKRNGDDLNREFADALGETVNFSGICEYDHSKPNPSEEQISKGTPSQKYEFRTQIGDIRCNINRLRKLEVKIDSKINSAVNRK